MREPRHAGSASVDDDRLASFHVAPDDATLESGSTTSGTNAASGAKEQQGEVVPAEHVVGGDREPDHLIAGHARQYDDIVEAIREHRDSGITVEAAPRSLATARG